MKFHFRKITELLSKEKQQLARLTKRKDSYMRTSLSEQGENDFTIVCTINGKIVGWSLAIVWDNCSELMVYVAKDCRGNGIGLDLVQKTMKRLPVGKNVRVYADNLKADEFWRKNKIVPFNSKIK